LKAISAQPTKSRFSVTSEQQAAFTQTRKLARPLRLRVTADLEGYPVIMGRYGQIEWFHEEGKYLAAYTTRRLTRGKLLALPAVVSHQIGDEELRVLFLVDLLPEVAGLLKARRRRPGHPAAARNLLRGPRHRASASL
jgi:hypothetical protein